MSITAGPITVRRFLIENDLSTLSDEKLVAAMGKHTFGKHGDASPDGVEYGWIGPDHLFQAHFSTEHVVFDEFVYANMRFDRTAPPASLVRSYIRMEELAAVESSETGRLTRRDRLAARDAAVAKANEEAKKGMFRKSSAIGVLIDRRENVLYLGHHGDGVAEKFFHLFRATFDTTLQPATSDHLALRIMESAHDARSIEDARPFHLTNPARPIADDSEEFIPDQTYLGREFLTWLWFKTETDGGTFTAGTRSVAVAMASLLKLDCDFRLTGSAQVRCDAPAGAPESRAALAVGKQPVRAGLILGGPGGDYALTLDGPKFAVSGMRVPEPTEPNRHGRFLERFNHLRDAVGMLDLLFGRFLGRRASADWTKELAAMTRWAKAGAPRAAGGHAPGQHAPPAAAPHRAGRAASSPARSESDLIIKFDAQKA